MTTQSPKLRHCTLSAIFAGVCGCLLACGARSGMDMPEQELPTLPGTGGAATTGGAVGTVVATGGISWTGGGAGGAPATAGVGVPPVTGGAGGTPATGGTSWATGGAGGAPLTGGAGGTPATGGAGGGFIGSCEYPSCLWNLIRDCLVVGPCTQQESQVAGGLTDISELCCSNGVNELVTLRMQSSKVTGSVAVSKNGSKCYDVSLATSGDGSTLYYTWLDPSGQAVAKASIAMTSSSDPVITCGNGETMPMTNNCQPDGAQAAVITTGTCQ